VRRRRSTRVEHIGQRRAAITIWRPTSTRRLEAKRREKKTIQKPNSVQYFTKGDILTNSAVLPDKISGKFRAKFTTSIQKRENYKERLILCHLSSRLRGGRRCGRSSTSTCWGHRRTCRRSQRSRSGSRRSHQRSDN
jgi:hypothetical protein